jgi:hypothetical protein
MKTNRISLHVSGQWISKLDSFIKRFSCIIIILAFYSCASLDSKNYKLRIKAVNKITDQRILYKVINDDVDYHVKIAAFDKITDQNLINKLAVECVSKDIRLEALKKVADQNVLFKIALKDVSYSYSLMDNNNEVKMAALNRITDQNLINRLAFEGELSIVRFEAIIKVTDQNLLYSFALKENLFEKVKVTVLNRLKPNLLAELATAYKETDKKLLIVSLLSDQNELKNIAQNNTIWEVRKAAFKKLNNNSLESLISEAKDPALILSAKIRLGRITWSEAFSDNYSSQTTLDQIVGAAAIVDSPKPTSYDVVSVCHKFIQLGDASRIPELINLLNTYGDVSLAEDYMNCGESSLEDAGCKWGRAQGYECTTGNGSSRVSWGSKK